MTQKTNFTHLFKKSTKKIVIALTLFLTVLVGNEVAHADYPDINRTQNGGKEVYFLSDQGIIKGNPDGTFKPENNLTRKEAIIMIGRAFKWEQKTTLAPIFKDVPKTDDAFAYIVQAANKGIISGFTDGTFRPKDKLTRAEMANILSFAFDLNVQYETVFTDTKSHWASETIQMLASNGITNGYPDGSFKPNESISRKHFSMMLTRALDASYRPATLMKTAVPAGDTLNVRETPDMKGKVVETLYPGAIVEVSPVKENGWVKIKYRGAEGYVASSYLIPYQLRNLPLEQKVIVLDAGHGGSDSGAVGNGLLEKNVVLNTTLKLKEALEKQGALIYMTRETDIFLTLEERAAFSEPRKADIFISVHANASNGSGYGSETYYNDTAYNDTVNPFPKESKQLATNIQNQLAKTDLRNRGVKQAAYLVIRKNSVPSVLVELGFIDNVTDAKYLKDDKFLQQSASLISTGIVQYFQAQK